VFALLSVLLGVSCAHNAPAPAPVASGEAGTRLQMPAPPQPLPTWTAGQREQLTRTLDAIFTDDITETVTGIAVVGARGETLFGRHALTPVAPASTIKLLAAACALNRLGPKYRFVTRFVTGAGAQTGHTLRGGLWLVGGGDPSLTSDDLRRGVGELARAGVRQVDGPLQVDDTAFSGPEQNPRWDPDDLDYDYAAGTSAISVDEDTVEFDVTPAAGGGAAHVRVVPDNDSIAFSGAINTAPAGDDSDVSIERASKMPSFGSLANAGSNDTSIVPRNDYVLDGHIAQGETQKFYKPVLGMAGYVGGVVATMLGARNISLAGGYREGPAPLESQPLWVHHSPPLEDLVHEMLVNSNNHTAETLLRILGEGGGHPGTDGAGIALEKKELERLGVRHDRMMLYDGSGLAPSDRIMPLTLAQLVSAMSRKPNGSVYVRSLPLAGIEGTVRHRQLRDALGRTRAKSGHIEDVNALAGTVLTRHHGRVAFAFIVNDPRANADVVYNEEDRALDALSDL